jgi:hypothetical protein
MQAAQGGSQVVAQTCSRQSQQRGVITHVFGRCSGSNVELACTSAAEGGPPAQLRLRSRLEGAPPATA